MENIFEHICSFEPQQNDIQGEVTWKSPSNIALIKYWGKYGQQLPRNASLSMTLTEAYTQTSITYAYTKNQAQRVFLFEGQESKSFAKRIWRFIDSLERFYPFLQQLDLKIESSNSFPHSAGIASSASAMSALALCLVDMERSLFNRLQNEESFFKKASYIARLGSGSASRSIFKGFSIWGENMKVNRATDNRFAIGFNEDIHPFYKGLKDAILIVDEGEKQVSSSLGHSLMDCHPFVENRLVQANDHLIDLARVLKTGKKDSFIKIVEAEATSLHALMMSSEPWFILMKPATITILEKVRTYRDATKKFICFTLDAGPNVHLLYHSSDEKEIMEFIDAELKPLCSQEKILYDGMGKGPQKIK